MTRKAPALPVISGARPTILSTEISRNSKQIRKLADEYDMQITSIALQGMNHAQSSLDSTARRLAKPVDPDNDGDTSSDMVDLLEAQNGYTANANVARVGDQLTKRTIDLLA